MKKIMKKALSLMLALVMVVSLATITTKAAENELDVTSPWEVMADCSQETQFYIYEATENGTITVDITNVFGEIGCIVSSVWGDSSFTTIQKKLTVAETLIFDVKADCVYQIEFAGISGDTQKVVFKSSFATGSEEEGSEGEDSSASTAGSSLDTAIDLTANKTINVAFNGTTFYTVGMLDNSKTYNVTVTNNTVGPQAGQQQIGVTAYYNGAADGETQYGYGSATAVVKPTLSGSIYFSVNNIFDFGDLNATVTVEEVSEDDGSSSSNALVLGTNTVHVTVVNYNPQATEVTFTAAEAGTYVLSPAEGENNADVTVVLGEYDAEWIEEYPYEFELEANGTITFLVATSANPITTTEDDIDLVIEKKVVSTPEVEGSGTEDDPYVIIMGDNTATLANDDSYVYYTYTAEEKGALCFEMSGDNASWFYDGYVNTSEDIDQFINPNKTWTTNQNSSTDTEPVSSRTIYLEAGDKVVLTVSTATNSDWTRPAGTVVFSAVFLPGEEPEGGEVELDEYVISDVVLELGDNGVVLASSAETTIYEFAPEESGVYKFEVSEEYLLGYWGSGTFFVSDYTENKTNTLSKEIKDDEVGNSIMVGVKGQGECKITVLREGDAEERVETPTVVYDNIITPNSYTHEGEVEYVDVWDEIKNTAVLGEDGLYHLDSADGPVLFVDILDTTFIDLLGAYGYGQLKETVYDENDNPVQIVDYNEAFMEYYAAAEDGLYPLTKDLVAMLQGIGGSQNWYEEGSWVGGEYKEDEAWMFMCCYNEDVKTMETPFEIPAGYITSGDDDSTGGATTGGTTAGGNTAGGTTTGGNTTGGNTTTPAPKNGDSTNMMVWAIVMVVAAGVAVVAFESKRRAR